MTGWDGAHETAVEGLRLIRASQPSEPVPVVHEPSLCLIAQGSKRMVLGDAVYRYDAAHCLLIAIDLPVVAQVVEASPHTPYLSLRLGIDPSQIGDLMMEGGEGGKNSQKEQGRDSVRGLSVGCVDAALSDAAVRLVRLLDTPERIPVLAPLIRREISYLLLIGEQGAALRRIARANPETQAVIQSLVRLRHDFAAPLRMDALAREAGMSRSRFHQHFKAVTTLSPLQYQKRLRLHEARRLMLGEAADAATACYQVGYESPSQFSREYRRLFGESPHRDMARLRGDV